MDRLTHCFIKLETQQDKSFMERGECFSVSARSWKSEVVQNRGKMNLGPLFKIKRGKKPT